MSTTQAGPSAQRERILVVEDDRSLREGLAMNLRMAGHEVLTASDGDEGMQMAFDAHPGLIVLDVMMPGWTGLDILEELRKRGARVPVLILSARGTTPDKVAGLQLGADDYMTKPFDLPELLARVERMLQRSRAELESEAPLTVGDVTVNRAERSVRIAGRMINLTAKEFDILCLLAAFPGRVFTREAILEHVWGWEYDGTARTVDNFVASLRKKLETGRRRRKWILTVPRVGYKLEVQ